uniref:Uncharacterized protein n=1 Tax=Myotis myotis TaxID=51298 RepID=A0A7J7S234_MYOMY|nr:hypothetical protein mMyoMyo1_010073 [Myotis myotis]
MLVFLSWVSSCLIRVSFLQLLGCVKKTPSMACVLRTGSVWEGLLWSGQAGSGSKLSGQEQLLFGVEGWVGECCSEQDVCGVEGQAGSGMLQAPDWQMCSEDWGRPGGWVESQVEEVIDIQVGKSLREERACSGNG